MLRAAVFCSSLLSVAVPPAANAQPVTPSEVRDIAKEAYIYGFPLVDNYRIQHSYFVDRSNPEFKAPWNTLFNNARVYTPEDKAIQTPNSDTPYSFVGADLRTEPLVLTVPAIEQGPLLLAAVHRHVHASTSPMSAAAQPATTPAASCWPDRAGRGRRRRESRR